MEVGAVIFMSYLSDYCWTALGFQNKKVNRIRIFFQDSSMALDENFILLTFLPY